jgi:MFS family permease
MSGALITLVPLYLAEVAPPQIRGRVVGTTGIMIGIGYASASWIGFAFYFVHAKNTQWRVPTAIQCLAPLVLAAGVWSLPESPRWRKLKSTSLIYAALTDHDSLSFAKGSNGRSPSHVWQSTLRFA